MVEKVVRLSGGQVPYFTFGKGPTLLFLHGGVATPYAYRRLLELLSTRFTLFAPTLPGHGNSFSIRPDWSVEDFIGTIEEFTETVKCKPEILSGHSLGGAFALYMASMGRGKKAVVFNTLGIPVATTPRMYMNYLLAEAKAILRKRPSISYLKQTAPTAGTLVHTILRHPKEVPWLYTKAPAINISHHLRSIRIPTYLICGSQDRIIPLSTSLAIQKLIPKSTLIVLQGVGHTFPVTAPEITFEKMKAIMPV